MKLSRLRPLLIATAFALPALAHAHPGHDGDHELVWEYSHLAGHPLATLACLTVLAAAAWVLLRMVRTNRKTRTEQARRR